MSGRITEGSIVHWSLRAGLWRVVRLAPSRDSHSPIPIFDAEVEPIGEGWGRGSRWARLADLAPAPVDLEDFPCSPA